LSWIAPANNGGSIITDYIVEFKLSSEPTNWSSFADVASTVTTATVTGLTNNLSYDFRVSAVNVAGRSGVNSSSTPSPATTPPPQNPPASGGGGGHFVYPPAQNQTPTQPPVNIPPQPKAGQPPAETIPTVPPTKLPVVNVPPQLKAGQPSAETVPPTTPNKKPNEVSATPTENPKETANNSWTLIIIAGIIILIVFGGFTIFVLYQRRKNKEKLAQKMLIEKARKKDKIILR
jgi:hypothetical protein